MKAEIKNKKMIIELNMNQSNVLEELCNYSRAISDFVNFKCPCFNRKKSLRNTLKDIQFAIENAKEKKGINKNVIN